MFFTLVQPPVSQRLVISIPIQGAAFVTFWVGFGRFDTRETDFPKQSVSNLLAIDWRGYSDSAHIRSSRFGILVF
jgi:hypothetical protein